MKHYKLLFCGGMQNRLLGAWRYRQGNPVEFLQQALATILVHCKTVSENPLAIIVFQYFI